MSIKLSAKIYSLAVILLRFELLVRRSIYFRFLVSIYFALATNTEAILIYILYITYFYTIVTNSILLYYV